MRRLGVGLAGAAVVLVLVGKGGLSPATGQQPTDAAAIPAALTLAPAADPLALHVVVLAPRSIGSAFPLEEEMTMTIKGRDLATGLPKAVTISSIEVRDAIAGSVNAIVDAVRGLPLGAPVTLRRGGGMATIEARLIAVSRDLDLAVLRVPPAFAPAEPAAESAALPSDLPLTAAGSVPVADPRVLAAPRRAFGAATGASLAIAGIGPGLVVRLAGVAPGFSGGPVMDARGRLVGMIVAIRRVAGTRLSAFAPRAAAAEGGVSEALILPVAAIRAEVQSLLAAAH